MPIRVKDLEKERGALFLRGKLLFFLRENLNLAYTLKELTDYFFELDKKKRNPIYKNKRQVLYKLIYGYLREFSLKGLIVHKGNYYHYKTSKTKKNVKE